VCVTHKLASGKYRAARIDPEAEATTIVRVEYRLAALVTNKKIDRVTNTGVIESIRPS